MSESGGRNFSQKLETFTGCTENDYLCLVIKLLLEVENCVGIIEVKFYANPFSSLCSILCFWGECLTQEHYLFG